MHISVLMALLFFFLAKMLFGLPHPLWTTFSHCDVPIAEFW